MPSADAGAGAGDKLVEQVPAANHNSHLTRHTSIIGGRRRAQACLNAIAGIIGNVSLNQRLVIAKS